MPPNCQCLGFGYFLYRTKQFVSLAGTIQNALVVLIKICIGFIDLMVFHVVLTCKIVFNGRLIYPCDKSIRYIHSTYRHGSPSSFAVCLHNALVVVEEV